MKILTVIIFITGIAIGLFANKLEPATIAYEETHIEATYLGVVVNDNQRFGALYSFRIDGNICYTTPTNRTFDTLSCVKESL